MTDEPRLSEHFYLRVGCSWIDGVLTYHVWDLAGFVASTNDEQELGEWLLYQQEEGSSAVGYGALRERFFPGTYEQKLADLAAQGSSRSTPIHSRLGRARNAKVAVLSADDLLKELDL